MIAIRIVLSVGQVANKGIVFQSDWITSRVIRRLAAWYTDYCLNEIRSDVPKVRVG